VIFTFPSAAAAAIAGSLLFGALADPSSTPPVVEAPVPPAVGAPVATIPVTREDIYVPNASLTTSGATILNDGHVDIAALVDSDRLVTRIKDTSAGTAPIWREPEETVLQLLPESQTAVPPDAAFGFLGAPGSPVWQVTQTQQDGLLWPGWSTEALPAAATRGGVTWTLSDVEGYPDAAGEPAPVGDFSLYEVGTFGAPTVLFDSTALDRTVPSRPSFVIPQNVHAHGTWSFTAEGAYCLSFTRSAETPAGAVLTDDFVLAVAVGAVAVRSIDPARCFAGAEPGPDGPPAPVDPAGPVDPPAPATPGAPPAPPVPPLAPIPVPPSTTVAATQCVAGATILSSGHVDYASRIVDGRLQSLIKDGTTPTTAWREPSGTVVWLKPSSRVTLPAGYGAIGAPGSSVWQVPQTQNADLVWLGWNSEELSAAQVASPVSWTMDSVSGPGGVKVYLQGSFGEVKEIVFDRGGTHSIALGKHVHANWAFAAEGIYRMTFTQTVTLASGARSSDTETLTVAVGSIDPRTAISGGTGCGPIAAGAPGRAAAADPAAAAAAQAAAQAAAAQAAASKTERERPSRPSSPGAAARSLAATAEPSPVPLLLLVLGGLLVTGAAVGGGLWLRHARAGTSTVPGG
jgi:putative ABC transporter-associated repeat protein